MIQHCRLSIASRLALGFALVQLSVAPTAVLQARTLYAAPQGVNKGTCERQSPCSLELAQTQVRAMLQTRGADIDVQLLDGVFRLHQPLQFNAQDSGTPGHPVVWHAAPNAHPILAGSRVVRGDTTGRWWTFAVRPDDDFSSIYVDAQRRWPSRSAPCPACSVDSKGLANLPPEIESALRVGSMAVLHARWRDFHCRVTTLEPGRVTFAQPCWANASIDSRNGWSVASPVGKYYRGIDWFENLAGMPNAPGSYTVDADRRTLRYWPKPEEVAQAPLIELPQTESLLQLTGSRQASVHDLIFRGLTFAYSAWRRPESDAGYVSLQAGYLVDGMGRYSLPDNGEGMTRTGSAVSVRGGHDIVFDQDEFLHLAAAGLAITDGSHGAAVVRSRFSDLGGGAVFVGDTSAHPADASDISSGLLIADNRIDHVAAAYRDNVAIMAGFVYGIDILHNTLSDLPYSGISTGWGWNYEGPAPVEAAVHIVGNRIERVMLQLADGGGIYTQGASTPGSSCIVRNAVDMRRGGEGNAIYLDEHSVDYDVQHNVLLGAWVSAWAPWSGHLRIVHNWTDTAGKPHHAGPTKIWAPNFTGLSSLPTEAQSVLREAGVRAKQPSPQLPIRVIATCPAN